MVRPADAAIRRACDARSAAAAPVRGCAGGGAGRRNARRAAPQGRDATAPARSAGDRVAAWREPGMIYRVTDLIPVVLLALACVVAGYFILTRLLPRLPPGRQPRLRHGAQPPARHAFVRKRAAGPLPTGELIQSVVPVIGQSWGLGVIVVAWDEVVSGARDATDGHNVVLHEFAHQLDREDGVADGVPLLSAGALRTWAR